MPVPPAGSGRSGRQDWRQHLGRQVPGPRRWPRQGGRRQAGQEQGRIRAFAQNWLGKNLVTYQTDANGQPVTKILVESCTDIARNCTWAPWSTVALAAWSSWLPPKVVWRLRKSPTKPRNSFTRLPSILVGPQPYQARELAFKLGLVGDQIKAVHQDLHGPGPDVPGLRLRPAGDQPLVITDKGNLHCLDGKINIDANALYRQPKLREMHDPSQDDPAKRTPPVGAELCGARWQHRLHGQRRGLAMGTMDIVNLHGGSPANFLDVGGGATKERVTEAFKIILSDSKVQAVLVNILAASCAAT